MATLDDRTAAAYLELLGVDARPGEVGAATLAALQRAHLAAVPYENLDVVRGRPPGIDPAATVERILRGRGGYCFHLNGAFTALLEWLRVDVTRHLAGVWGRSADVPPGANGNHLGVTVDLGALGEGEWLVEVGAGDGPPAPVPLAAGEYEQEGFRYRLGPSPLAPGGWRLEHDPRGSWHLFDMAAAPALTGDFAGMHTTLSTSPESGFVRIAIVARRPAGGGLELLRGCVLTEWTGGEPRRRDVDGADEWWGLVLDRFGLDYRDLTAAERAALWRHVRGVHERWDAEGRP